MRRQCYRCYSVNFCHRECQRTLWQSAQSLRQDARTLLRFTAFSLSGDEPSSSKRLKIWSGRRDSNPRDQLLRNVLAKQIHRVYKPTSKMALNGVNGVKSATTAPAPPQSESLRWVAQGVAKAARKGQARCHYRLCPESRKPQKSGAGRADPDPSPPGANRFQAEAPPGWGNRVRSAQPAVREPEPRVRVAPVRAVWPAHQRPAPGSLLHERRNGHFVLQVTGHPSYGLPGGQDRLVRSSSQLRPFASRSKTITFRSAAEMLDTFGMQQGGSQYRRLVGAFSESWVYDLLRYGHAALSGHRYSPGTLQLHVRS
jgi:hypothetical protein